MPTINNTNNSAGQGRYYSDSEVIKNNQTNNKTNQNNNNNNNNKSRNLILNGEDIFYTILNISLSVREFNYFSFIYRLPVL